MRAAMFRLTGGHGPPYSAATVRFIGRAVRAAMLRSNGNRRAP
jgi:hypothetical protein